MGDFDTSGADRSKLEQCFEQRFSLGLNSNVNDKTTLAGTCSELTTGTWRSDVLLRLGIPLQENKEINTKASDSRRGRSQPLS